MRTALRKILNQVVSRIVLIRFVPIAAVYLVELAVFKAIQIQVLTNELAMGSVLQGMTSEVGFIIPLVIGAALLYGPGGRLRRGIVLGAYGFIVLAALILSTFNHGYLLATGSNISFGTVQYWLNNMDGTNEIIASEASIGKVVLLSAQFFWVVLALALPRLRRIQKWIDASPADERRQTIGWFIGCLLIYGLCLVLPSPKGRAAVIKRSIPAHLIGSSLHRIFHSGGKVSISENQRQGGRLEFRSRADAPRPNVVFIIFESLNWKSSDVHVPGIGTTPFLAELAPKSAVVAYPYTIVPHTSKAVMPLLCGIYPYFKQKTVENTPGILPKRCLPHILGNIGYRSAFFQPAYNFEKRDSLVRNMGFHVYKGGRDFPREGFETINYFGAEDKVMVAPSMEWVDSVRDKPFLLTYLTLATHHNYVTPQSYPYMDFGKADKSQNDFFNAVRYVDEFVRDVFQEFENRGLLKNTVFIVAGDHGEAFAEHGRRQHDLIMWEEGLRTAALIYAPGLVDEGQIIEGIRSNLDFVPTVSGLLGLELVSGRFVGKSLFEPVAADRKLFHACWFNNECLAIHDGFIKTIFHYGSQEMEVYDNRTDPFDRRNLAGTGPYDESYLQNKKEEMLHFTRVVNQEYHEWRVNSAAGKVSSTRPKMERKLDAIVGGKILIAGVEVPKKAAAGQDIQIKLLFKSLKPALTSDRLFVHLVCNKEFLNADHVPLGGTLPLSKWKPGDYILDEHSVHIPGTWPAGDIQIYVGVWNRKKQKRYPVVDASRRLTTGRFEVAKIPLQASAGQRGLTEVQTREKIGAWVGKVEPAYEKPVGVIFGDSVELVGVTLARVDVMQAGTAEMTYVFKSLKRVNPKWRLIVRLIREDGTTIRADHVPIGGLYPTDRWNPGEYIVDKHRIHIDMYRSKVGRYGVWLGFKDGGRPVPIGSGDQIDHLGRVRIGEVTISKRDARQ